MSETGGYFTLGLSGSCVGFTGEHSKPQEGPYKVPKKERSFDQKKVGEQGNSERVQVSLGVVIQGRKSGVCSEGSGEPLEAFNQGSVKA